jgi:nitroreductase
MVKPVYISLDFIEKSQEQMIQISSDLYKEMKKRRTVRHFSDRPVSKEIIHNAILTAGTAPNGANLQPWHFVIISDKEIKKQIREAAEAEERTFYQERAPGEWLEALAHLGTDENKPFLETAPYLIVLFQKKYIITEDGRKQKTYYSSESVGIAAGMLITVLHLSGLATLTHTPSPMGFLNRILNRPANEKPYLILVTGYPAKKAKVPKIDKYPLNEIATIISND